VLNLVYVGDNALFKLRRPYLSERVTRFGNMFYVREQVGGGALGTCVCICVCIVYVCMVYAYVNVPLDMHLYLHLYCVCW
jgi:hypothetical protein